MTTHLGINISHQKKNTFEVEDGVPFPKVGYVSSLEGMSLSCSERHAVPIACFRSRPRLNRLPNKKHILQ